MANGRNARNAAARGRGMPFRVTGQKDAVQLRFPDFTEGGPHQISAEYRAAYFEIPRSQLFRFQRKPNTLYIKGVVEGDNSDAGISRDGSDNFVVDLQAVAGGPYGVIRSELPAPSLPTSDHPDIVAYVSDDGGTTFSEADIEAVDFTNDTITVAGSASDDYVKVYFLLQDGEVTITLDAPVGVSQTSIQIFNDPLNNLHAQKQAGVTAPRFFPQDTDVPEKFRLSVNIVSAAEVRWLAEAEHQISVDALRVPIEVTNGGQLARVAIDGLSRAF